MSKNRSLLRNIFTFGVSSATLAFLFLLAVIAARYLGPEDFGIFSFALAFVFFFDFLLDPGLYHLMIREIARDETKVRQYMLHAFVWKLIAIPVVFLLVVLVVNFIHELPRIHNAVYLMAISSFIKSIKDVYRSVLLAHENFKIEAISSVIEKGGLLVFGGLALFMDYGLYGLCWSFVIVRALDLLIIHIMSRQIFDVSRPKFHLEFLIDMLKAGIPIGAYYVTLNLYNYIDTVMISIMRNAEEVGWYSASYKVYEGLLIIPVIIGTVMLPRLSSSKSGDSTIFKEMVTQGWKYSLILALLVISVGVPLSYNFTDLFYGELYTESAITLQVLLYGVAFAYMVNFLQTVMISIDRQKVLVLVAVLGLVLNVALNYIAIELYGYVGAAVVTVIVEALVFMVLSYYIISVSVGSSLIFQLLKVIACWLLPAIPVMFIAFDLSNYIRASLWSFGFIVLLRLTRAINDKEWGRFSMVFQSIK
jgi:O-antigen/teichoic acid export membrane protein